MAFLDFLPMIGGALQNVWNATFGQSQSKDLMRYQYQLNQQAVEQQNRYNSPLAQMERLREAGLNPNLVYGSGVEGNQSSAPNVGISQRGTAADFGFNDAVSNIFRRRQLENETGISVATQDKLAADKMLSYARYLDTMEDVARKDATFEPFVKKAQLELDKMQSEIELNQRKTDNVEQQTNNLKIVANNLVEQGNLIRSRTNLTEEQALTEAVKRDSLRAGIRLNDAQCKQIAAMIPYIKAGQDLRELEYDIKDLEFESGDELNKWLAEHPNVELTGEVIGYIMEKLGFRDNSRSGRTKKRKRKH